MPCLRIPLRALGMHLEGQPFSTAIWIGSASAKGRRRWWPANWPANGPFPTNLPSRFVGNFIISHNIYNKSMDLSVEHLCNSSAYSFERYPQHVLVGHALEVLNLISKIIIYLNLQFYFSLSENTYVEYCSLSLLILRQRYCYKIAIFSKIRNAFQR